MLKLSLDLHELLWPLWTNLQKGRKEQVTADELYYAASELVHMEMRDWWICEKGEQLERHFGERLVPWYDEILTALRPVSNVQYWFMEGNRYWLESDPDCAINLAMALAMIMYDRRYSSSYEDVLTKAAVVEWMKQHTLAPPPESADQMSLFAM